MPNKPKGYCGIIPFQLYAEFQVKCPQNFKGAESDRNWLERCMKRPSLLRNTFMAPSFRNELQVAVANHLMAVTGAKPTADNPRQSPATYAQKFNQDRSAQDADLAMNLLLEQHKLSLKLPPNGSIFWNGVNEIALATLVKEWSEHNPQVYNSLEGSTSVSYINKRFEWGPKVEHFFNEASAQLGLAAVGHTTAICRFGLRNDSILTKTELPRMINHMQEQIAQNQTPKLTDITLVVINPIGSQAVFEVHTNTEILNVKTWGRAIGANGWPVNPGNASECLFVKPLGQFWRENGYAKENNGRSWVGDRVQTSVILPADVKLFWQRRGRPADPEVVAKITNDATVHRLFTFTNMAQPHNLPGLFPKRV